MRSLRLIACAPETGTVMESIGYSSVGRMSRSVMRSAVVEEHGYIVQLTSLSTLGFAVPDVHADVANLGHGIDGIIGGYPST